VIGIGTDLVEIDRFRVALHRTPSIVDRLFTPSEQSYARGRRDPAQHLAVRFAAKEAALKAMGVGLGGARFRDIEVVREPSGAPHLQLHDSATELATERGVTGWLLTLSHTSGCAQAIAVALGEGRA
jgi:holo-[acyl-carrier protein] synthase